MTAIEVAVAKRDSKSRSRDYNELCHLLQRYTQIYLPPPTHHVRMTSSKCIPQLHVHVHVIQDDGGTDLQSSQDRPASDTQDRSTTPSEYQDSPTTHQNTPTIHLDSANIHQDSPTIHQDSPTIHQDSPPRHQDTTDQDSVPPVPQVPPNLPLYIPIPDCPPGTLLHLVMDYVGMAPTRHTHFSKQNGSELPNAAVLSPFRPIHVLYECFCTH